ncbi:MAG TPA: MFS transporter [Pyrinomonadaceae bacterium]|nr:MFS transporter [Pyrinomonadaceae bacterium]
MSTKLLGKRRLSGSERLDGGAAFGVVWVGQVVSLFGSHLAGFVLGVWVYQQTKSVTAFSLISFFTVLPEIALLPVAGVIVDRFDRRLVMLLGVLGSGLCGAVLAAMAIMGQLQLWHIYLMLMLSSAFESVQFPALSASITLLVSRRNLSRANGMVSLGTSFAMVAAPVLAGVFLQVIGLTRVLLINVAAYAFAVLTLCVVRITRPEQSPRADKAPGSFWREAAQVWKFVTGQRELIALLILFAITNFSTGIVQVLLPPYILSFKTPQSLGTIMSAGGVGVVAGSVLLSIWEGPRQKMRAIFIATFLRGVVLFLAVLQPNGVVIGTAAFIFLFCDPVIFTSSQTIWQTKVPAEVQGRAFAMRRLVAWSTLPLAYAVAGPLADRIFEPWMAPQGPLARVVGGLFGTGPGRGIAVLFIVLGLLTVIAVVAGFLYQPLRDLEDRLPDAARNEDVRKKTVN